MKEIKIYTAGKMAGLTYEEQMNWRYRIQEYIRRRTNRKITFVHPPMFYTYDSAYHKTELEVKNWDINQVRDSDIVIVNLDGVNSSVGTHFELSMVDAINSFGNKHIYLIGVGESNEVLHPWIECSLHRHEKDFEDAAEYICEYLLV